MEAEFGKLIVQASDLQAVSWGLRPDNNDFPRIQLHLISEDGQHTMSGPSKFRRASVQCDIFAENATDVIALKNKIRSMDGFKSDGVIAAVLIDRVRSSGTDAGNPSNVILSYSIDFNVFFRAA